MPTHRARANALANDGGVVDITYYRYTILQYISYGTQTTEASAVAPFVLPDGVGIVVGQKTDFRYAVLQVCAAGRHRRACAFVCSCACLSLPFCVSVAVPVAGVGVGVGVSVCVCVFLPLLRSWLWDVGGVCLFYDIPWVCFVYSSRLAAMRDNRLRAIAR